MTDPNEKPGLTDQASNAFKIVIGEPSNGNLPVVAGTGTPVSTDDADGGLTYQNAHPDERAEIDKIIASIDLTNPDTIINLGTDQRTQLATLSDQILDSIQPSVKLAFAEALRQLVDMIKTNSLTEIKKRIEDGSVRRVGHSLLNAIEHKDNKIDASKRLIQHFMEDITHTRKTIQEMTNHLQDQQVALNQNYANIKKLGAGMVVAAQGMRIVHAASEEYIRRVKAEEITVLKDLAAIAEKTKRPDDSDTLQLAQAGWSALRTQNGSLLGSIATFEKNVATLAFTKQADVQNRMQTQNALSNIVEDWKADLALFAEVTIENAATQLLDVVDQLTAQADKAGKDMFDMLVDSVVARSGKTDRSLRQIITDQSEMAAKLASVGPQVAAHYEELEKDEAALKTSSAEFRASIVHTFSNPNGILSAPPKPAPGIS